jgi:hypothetical protein
MRFGVVGAIRNLAIEQSEAEGMEGQTPHFLQV